MITLLGVGSRHSLFGLNSTKSLSFRFIGDDNRKSLRHIFPVRGRSKFHCQM